MLAGISIQAMTSTGLFEAAGRAKKEAKRAQVIEWLNLKLVEKQSENTKGTSEDIIKAMQESVKTNISELETIGRDIVVEDTKTEEDGEKADIYFYVQVDKDVYKVELKGAKFIGEAGKFPPIIKIESITSTTNSITVKVSTKRNESGKLEFYIKPEDEEKYNNIKTDKNVDNLEFTYTGLEQNKNYSIKIVAIAENKQTAEAIREDIQVGNVPELTQRDVEFTYSPSSWTNGSVTVTAKLKEGNVQGYTLKITDGNPINPSKQTALGWTKANDGITVDTNKTIYAVLVDSEGQVGAVASGNVDKIDKQKPVANVSGTTTNSITFTGKDTAKTGEKASGIVGYIVKDNNTVPDKDDSTWKSYNGASKTVSGLTQGKTYYVFVKDNAGNVSVVVSGKTSSVPSGLTEGAITFGTTTWSGGKASTTISTNTEYMIQYQINSITGTWTTGTSVSGLMHGDIIYARLWDGTNGGVEVSQNILDGIAPTKPNIQITSGTLGNNSWYISDVNINITAGIDNESGIQKTTYSLNGAATQGESTIPSNGIITISAQGITTITSYSYDNAGNKSEQTSMVIKKDSTAPTINLSQTNITSREYTKTVSVSLFDNESGINIKKYAPGYRDVSYFAGNGSDVPTSFNVTTESYHSTANRTNFTDDIVYTVYAKNQAGLESVNSIKITNLLILYNINPSKGIFVADKGEVDTYNNMWVKTGGTQYGPYCTLPAGTYQVNYTGYCEDQGTYDILYNIEKFLYKQYGTPSYTFSLSETTGPLEFRLSNSSQYTIGVFNIQLKQLN